VSGGHTHTMSKELSGKSIFSASITVAHHTGTAGNAEAAGPLPLGPCRVIPKCGYGGAFGRSKKEGADSGEGEGPRSGVPVAHAPVHRRQTPLNSQLEIPRSFASSVPRSTCRRGGGQGRWGDPRHRQRRPCRGAAPRARLTRPSERDHVVMTPEKKPHPTFKQGHRHDVVSIASAVTASIFTKQKVFRGAK